MWVFVKINVTSLYMGEFKIVPFMGSDMPEVIPRITVQTANDTLHNVMRTLEQLIQGPSVSFQHLFQLSFELVSSLPLPIAVIGQAFVARYGIIGMGNYSQRSKILAITKLEQISSA